MTAADNCDDPVVAHPTIRHVERGELGTVAPDLPKCVISNAAATRDLRAEREVALSASVASVAASVWALV